MNKSKCIKRFCSIISLAVIITIMNVFATNVFAQGDDFTVENGVLKKYTGTGEIVSIPQSVYKIGQDAFSGNNKVREIVFHDAVVDFGARAFKNCTGLTKITIPPYVTNISTEVFRGCTNLSTVVLHDYVESIGASTFLSCKSLTSIKLPQSLMTIGFSAFEDCPKLSSITVPSSTEMIGDFAFGKSPIMITIYGVANSRAQTYAQTFGNIFIPIIETQQQTKLDTRPPLPKINIAKQPSTLDMSSFPNGVTPSDWAVKPVLFLDQNTNINKLYFMDYKEVISRKLMAYLLVEVYYKLIGTDVVLETTSKPFSDTKDPYVTKARELGLVKATNEVEEIFSPDNIVTREQMATYLIRLLDLSAIPYNEEDVGYIKFDDHGDISEWAIKDGGLIRSFHLGLVNGIGKNRFMPKASLTREAIYTMFYNLFYNLERIKKMQAREKPIVSPSLLFSGIGKYPEGWIEEAYNNSPVIIDINGDGKNEIIFGRYSIYCADASTGKLLWRIPSGFDRSSSNAKYSGRIWSSLIVADVDGDGKLEIVSASANNENDTLKPNQWKGIVAVYDANGYFKQGWPQHLPHEVRSLVVADLDKDGKQEIIVGQAYEGATNIYVYQNNGKLRQNWPQLNDNTWGMASGVTNKATSGYSYGVFDNNIGVGDIDGNGKLEIIVPSDENHICAYDMDGKLILANPIFGGRTWGRVGVWEDYAYEITCDNEGFGMDIDWKTGEKIDYNTLPREKRYMGNFANSKAKIVDVNEDGINEIVVVGKMVDKANMFPELPKYHGLFIFNGDRTRFKTDKYDWTSIPRDSGESLCENYYKIEAVSPEVIVEDLDKDGIKELIYPSFAGKVLCYGLDKTGWEYSVFDGVVNELASALAVVDLNKDGYKEIVFTTITQKDSKKDGSLYILNHKGTLLHKSALPVSLIKGVPTGSITAPVVMDIDGDSRLEIVINTYGSGVVVYKF